MALWCIRRGLGKRCYQTKLFSTSTYNNVTYSCLYSNQAIVVAWRRLSRSSYLTKLVAYQTVPYIGHPPECAHRPDGVWWVYGLAFWIKNIDCCCALALVLIIGKMVVGSRKAGLASLFWVLTMMDHDGVRIAYTYCYTFGWVEILIGLMCVFRLDGFVFKTTFFSAASVRHSLLLTVSPPDLRIMQIKSVGTKCISERCALLDCKLGSSRFWSEILRLSLISHLQLVRFYKHGDMSDVASSRRGSKLIFHLPVLRWGKCWEKLPSGIFSSAPAQTVTVTAQPRSAHGLLLQKPGWGNMFCSCPPSLLVTPARVRRMRWHARLTICLLTCLSI